jgi:hypothetical protein
LRKKYVQSAGDCRKRTHKLFESANVKLDSVVSDLFGVTGRNLMQLLVEDRKALTLSDIQDCVCGKLKGKGTIHAPAGGASAMRVCRFITTPVGNILFLLYQNDSVNFAPTFPPKNILLA